MDVHLLCYCHISEPLVFVFLSSFMKKSAVSNLDIDESLQKKKDTLTHHIYNQNKQKGAKSAKDKRKWAVFL